MGLATDTVPGPVRAMPRLASRVNVALAVSVPPFNTSWPGVATAGAVPSPLSAAMLSVPAVIEVTPVYVFTPDSVNVPRAALCQRQGAGARLEDARERGARIEPPEVSVTAPAALLVTVPAPASDPTASSNPREIERARLAATVIALPAAIALPSPRRIVPALIVVAPL